MDGEDYQLVNMSSLLIVHTYTVWREGGGSGISRCGGGCAGQWIHHLS